MTTFLPFKNLKVLELASVLAGPLVGSFFSELGANVTKIENKRTHGEMTRKWRHAEEKYLNDESDYYTAANFNKNVLYLDLGDAKDYHLMTSLVKENHVVIANFLPSIAQKLECTFHDLVKYNSHLIYVNLVAYSETDDRPGFDLLMQAECGYISITGQRDALAKMPTAMIDILAAHQMKEAILIALYQQAKGMLSSCELSVSLHHSGLTGLVNQGSSYLNSGISAQPMGTLHPSIAPYGEIFHSQDDIPFVIAIGTDEQFTKFCDGFNLVFDSKFDNNQNRVVHRQELFILLQEKLSCYDYNYIRILLNNVGIPITKINDIAEALDSEESQQMIKTTNSGKKRISDIAFKRLH